MQERTYQKTWQNTKCLNSPQMFKSEPEYLLVRLMEKAKDVKGIQILGTLGSHYHLRIKEAREHNKYYGSLVRVVSLYAA